MSSKINCSVVVLLCNPHSTPPHQSPNETQHFAPGLATYLAVVQCQLKHLGGAPDQAHAQAVQHHALAALENCGGEVLRLHPLDKAAKAAGDRVLWGRTLHHCWGGGLKD